MEEWEKKDPIARCEDRLRREEILSDELKQEIHVRIETEIADASRYAEEAPHPEGSEGAKGVYAD